MAEPRVYVVYEENLHAHTREAMEAYKTRRLAERAIINYRVMAGNEGRKHVYTLTILRLYDSERLER